MYGELPFHSGAATVAVPLNDDALVWRDDFRCHLSRDIGHFPFPCDLFADFESPAALGEPTLSRDAGINEGVKDIGDRLTNEHAASGNRYVFQVEVAHIDY